MQKDEAVVLAAIAQDASALECAHAALKRDRGVVLAAVARDGLALQSADAVLVAESGYKAKAERSC